MALPWVGGPDRAAPVLPDKAERTAAGCARRDLAGNEIQRRLSVFSFSRPAASLMAGPVGVAARARAGNGLHPQIARRDAETNATLAITAAQLTREGA